mgnify:CR=1 FL=1
MVQPAAGPAAAGVSLIGVSRPSRRRWLRQLYGLYRPRRPQIEAAFDVAASRVLDAEQKRRVIERCGPRICDTIDDGFEHSTHC